MWWFAHVHVFWQPLVVGALLTLVPQAARRARSFRLICGTVAGLLLLVQPPGIWFGLFLLLPAALMLTVAGASARVTGGGGAAPAPVAILLAALALIGSCLVLLA
ncbi:hypothetical protein [Kitasatospora cheerisanensis]|uniref:Uncharacterized protein n=1 Tax=Kitasatospora cheerisanensis KCTC 2395 TaxID=1348663 RepID=A0A066ZAN8_9ACTN|nr:hypothetical protein [Kitasatospora cheerisanensis]KDN87381.1 hypothetical protein KCH_08720 [Kitasatospora cheerisanensis KCTC 2395]